MSSDNERLIRLQVVYALAKTNELPSASELKQILELESIYKTDIASFITQAPCLEVDMKMNHCHETLSLIAMIQAPIRSLPYDILREIFTFAVSHMSEGFAQARKNRTVLSVSQVCHAWRDMAYEISLLWNAVVVEPGDFSKKRGSSAQLVKRSHMWPLKAKNSAALLTFDVHLPQRYKCLRTDSGDFLSALLFPYTGRISHLKIYSSCLDGYKRRQLLPGTHHPFSELRTLILQLHPGARYPLEFDCLGSAPKLTKFATNNFTLSHGLGLLPWAQLTHLIIGSASARFWNFVLPQCQNLQFGHFTFGSWPVHVTALNISPFSLPSLIDLTIEFGDSSQVELRSVVHPKLQTLRCGVGVNVLNLQSFFETESFDSLYYLTLTSDLEVPVPKLVHWLLGFPQLVLLDIKLNVDYQSFLQEAGNNAALLPNLEVLFIYIGAEFSGVLFTAYHLYSIAEARFKEGRFKKLVVITPKPDESNCHYEREKIYLGKETSGTFLMTNALDNEIFRLFMELMEEGFVCEVISGSHSRDRMSDIEVDSQVELWLEGLSIV